MKGVVFTEFLEMVEDRFSPDIADQIVEQSELASGGAYTTLGTYDHGEMLTLVTHLSEATGAPVGDLVKAFGSHLFGRFVENYPVFFEQTGTAFDFLNNVEDYIHVEVRKLYPDAELPSIACEMPAPDQLDMTYRSSRPFAALAEGLVSACIDHFGEKIDMQVEDLSDGAGTAARFVLRRAGGAS